MPGFRHRPDSLKWQGPRAVPFPENRMTSEQGGCFKPPCSVGPSTAPRAYCAASFFFVTLRMTKSVATVSTAPISSETAAFWIKPAKM